MIHIFQVVGDPKYYDEKEFRIGNKSYVSCLSSEAFRRCLVEEGKKVKLTLLVPESLLLKKNEGEFAKMIKEKGVDDFEVVVIPSTGEFWVDEKKVELKTSVETIITCIFLHLLETKPESIYVDISTGQNIYPLSLLEATRRYITYRKLKGLLQGASINAFTIFPPPIVKNVYSYPVEIQPIDVKAFFSLPNANIDKIVIKAVNSWNKVEEIKKGYSNLIKKVRDVTKELRMAYNAIRLNVPLAFYKLLTMEAEVNEIEREIISFVKELIKPIETEISIERSVIDGVNVSNIFYSTALYSSIQEFKNSLNEPEIDEILQRFSELYKIKNLGVGVNEYFLLRDVEDIKSSVKNSKIKIEEGRGELLARIKHGDEFHKSTDKKRNFFAHSGFLQEYTLVKVDRGRIYVDWLREKTEEIEKWLLDPEKN